MTLALKRMSEAEFLEWCQHQEGRWELVGGEPLQMMAGTTQRHDIVTRNILRALERRLDGGSCRPWTDDVASRMMTGNIRRPDVTVDCGPIQPDSMLSSEPAAFFEVLSPSTEPLDLLDKADEYRQLPSLRLYVIVDPKRFRVKAYVRAETGWTVSDIIGADSVVTLNGLGEELTFAEIYRGVPFDA